MQVVHAVYLLGLLLLRDEPPIGDVQASSMQAAPPPFAEAQVVDVQATSLLAEPRVGLLLSLRFAVT